MANPCRQWEAKLEYAIKTNNAFNQLKFKEKLVECIVYTARLMIKHDKDAYREIINYGLEVAKKYNIPEVEYHLKIIEAESKPKESKGEAKAEVKGSNQ